MANSHTVTYPLYVTAGGVNDDMADIMVTFEGDIEPYRRETGPTYDCGGQPAEGGYAELTDAWMTPEAVAIFPVGLRVKHPRVPMSWLLKTLPEATLDDIAERIYNDWEQDALDRRTA